MAPAPEFPERRSDHVTRALFARVKKLEERCDSLTDINAELRRELAVLKESHVSKGWMLVSVLGVCGTLFAGAWTFSASLRDHTSSTISTAMAENTKAVTAQASRFEAFAERQAAVNIKTEAMYLRDIEMKPREEVRAIVRQTAKEK